MNHSVDYKIPICTIYRGEKNVKVEKNETCLLWLKRRKNEIVLNKSILGNTEAIHSEVNPFIFGGLCSPISSNVLYGLKPTLKI